MPATTAGPSQRRGGPARGLAVSELCAFPVVPPPLVRNGGTTGHYLSEGIVRTTVPSTLLRPSLRSTRPSALFRQPSPTQVTPDGLNEGWSRAAPWSADRVQPRPFPFNRVHIRPPPSYRVLGSSRNRSGRLTRSARNATSPSTSVPFTTAVGTAASEPGLEPAAGVSGRTDGGSSSPLSPNRMER